MAELPVAKDELKQAIEEMINENDISSMTSQMLRSKLEIKFNLNTGQLSNHRELISSLMDEYIASNLQQTITDDFDELDAYIKNNIDIDTNNNKNKNNPKSKNKKLTIMDIDYTNPQNSQLFSIYCDSNTNISYSIMLNQTDIGYGVKGHNKFYAIQLLKHKRGEQYKFITKWGRVGNKAQTNEEIYDSKQIAIKKFKKKFKDKTKNEFGEKHFTAVQGKYIPIAMDDNDTNNHNHNHNISSQSDEDNNPINDDEKSINSDQEQAQTQQVPPSKLDESLVGVLKIIFCKQLQCDTAKTFSFDLNRLPLGSLSKSQVDKGYNILCKINDILVDKKNRNNMNKYSNLTNKYYTIIPHDFGMIRPPIINTLTRLHKEIELIETLKQMIFTNKILKKRSKRKNPIDVHYDALHCDIRKLSKYALEYKNIVKGIQSTHAETHDSYELNVLNIFEVDRDYSKFRHLPFRHAFEGKVNGNCRLLYHGTRLSNFVGILSQGLRIAPPEAPSTGYMFGKGIYFADCASKSANYIHATELHPFGLLIICEVALGNIYPLINAEFLDKPPDGYHSVQGIGKNIPKSDGNSNFDIDGYNLSLGPLVKNNDENVIDNGGLLYNEYIVYDVGQVRMKYIVLTRFDFK